MIDTITVQSGNGHLTKAAAIQHASLSLTKAVIINLDDGSFVQCMFNPKEYALSKQNTWKPAEGSGANLSISEFSSGEPATLSMDLFFDSYAKGDDVRTYTNAIWELMRVDPRLKDPKNDRGRPPQVRFQWGRAWFFDAVITSINQRFTLFHTDGRPARSTLNVSFRQIKDEKRFPRQNPTSGGTGGERLWTTKEGDTLAWIAHKEYGDATLWRSIAEANRLAKVRRLRPGTVLLIPPR